MNSGSLVAGGLVAAAVLTASVGTAGRQLIRSADGRRRVLSVPGGLDQRSTRRLAPTVWAASAAVVLLGPAALAAASLVLAVAVSAHRMRWVRARRVTEAATAAAVADATTALAADLAAGHSPHAALAALSADASAGTVLAERLRWVSATGSLGGDVPNALRTAATTPGAEALGDVAAAWQVAEDTGSPLAPVLDQVARGIAQRQAGRRRLEVSMAGARSSARLLVALPVFGVLIGAGLGVSPLAFLLGPLTGRVCLVAGMALSAAGLVWTDRLAASALATGGSRP